MTRPVRLYSWRSRGAALASRRLEAVPGALDVVGLHGTRRLTTGPGGEVAEAVLLDDAPDTGRVLLLGHDGRALLDLAVRDWVPAISGINPTARGGSDDELAWSGFGVLLDAAGVPVRRDRLSSPPPEAAAETVAPPGPARAVLPVLLVALLGYLVGVRLSEVAVEVAGLGLALLGGLLGLLVDRAWRGRREAGALVGEVLAPAPGTAVTPRFARSARLVLGPRQGPVETVALVGGDEDQEWFDGPAGATGLRAVRLVTPPGRPVPDRALLVDGLGREVLRLRYDEWFGGPGGPALLARLQDRGLRVEQVQGPVEDEVVQQVYSWPRSGPGGALLDVAPDAAARQRNGLVGVLVAAGVLLLSDGAPVLLGLLAAAALLGPVAVELLSRLWLDRPRPPAAG